MKRIFFLFFLLVPIILNAQLYQVKGKVTGMSLEPLSFVTVNVQEQVNHAVTDNKGEFKTSLANGKYTMVFTLLGYKTLKRDIVINNSDIIVNIILEEDNQLLELVEVNAKYVDPARGVVQKVIRNKDKYIHNAYQCELYIKAIERENFSLAQRDSIEKIRLIEDSVSNTEKKRTKNISKKDSLQMTEESGDSVKSLSKKERKRMAYDMYNIAEIIINKSYEFPDKIKEERTACSLRGDKQSLFYLSGTEGEFNFYHNAVYCPSLSEMPFQSPLSTGGLLSYKYKTVKVFMEDGKKIFRIKVEPGMLSNSLVSGEMEIIDSLFCLRSYKFSFPKHHLYEYTAFEAEAFFIPLNDSLYRMNKMVFYYKMGNKKSGSNGKTVVFINNYTYKSGFAKKYFGNEVSTTFEEAYNKDSTFWKQARKEPFTESELRFIRMTDSIRTAHTTKPYLDSLDRDENKITLKKIALIGQTHYNREKDLRLFFNPLWLMYQPVGVGGARVKYGFGFNKKFKDKTTFNTFADVNYGLLNRDLNGTLNFSRLYDPFRLGLAGINTGRNYDIINSNNSWLAVFRTSNFYKNEHIRLWNHIELVNGLYWRTEVQYSTRKSISNIRNDTLTSLLFENYKYKAVSFEPYDAFYITNEFSYTPFQKYIREPKEKIVLGSRFPTLYMTHRKGIPGIFKSSINYDYLEFSIRHDIDLRFLGVAKYRFYTGRFINTNSIKTVDYKYQAVVGSPFFGNPLSSFQALEKSYITLDWHYAGHYLHRFNGALINRIPFAKYLNLVETGGAGFLVSPENNLSYFEVFVGVEKNIRIFKEMMRLGIFWVNAKSNDYNFRSELRFSIDMYNRVNNSWSY